MNQNGSLTAKLCLFARAVHAQEENPVFNDTKAGELLGEKDYCKFFQQTGEKAAGDQKQITRNKYDERLICQQVDCYFSPILTSRSAFTEECLSSFALQKETVQYVILGAGMDTFAFRNRNSSIEIFELDHPYTQNYKIRRIRELGWDIPENVHYIPVDFTKEHLQEVLKKSSFRLSVPTVFSILGLTYYLSEETFSSLLKEISSIAGKGDEIIFDYPDPSGFRSSRSRMNELSKLTRSMGETMTGGFTNQRIESLLKRNGLYVRKHLDPDMIEEKWFRNDERIRAFHCIHLILAMK